MRFNDKRNTQFAILTSKTRTIARWSSQHKLATLICLIAIGVLVFYASQTIFASPIYVYKEQGEVFVKHSDSNDFSEVVALRSQVDEGSVIKTENGFAHVVLRDGSIVSLDPYSEMQIEESNSLFTRLYQVSGNTWHRVKKLVSTEDDRYQIESGSVAASVRGTEFGVMIQSPTKSAVFLKHGSLQVRKSLPLLPTEFILEPGQLALIDCEEDCSQSAPIMVLQNYEGEQRFLESRFVERNLAISTLFGENYVIPSDFEQVMQDLPMLLEQYSSTLNLGDILFKIEESARNESSPQSQDNSEINPTSQTDTNSVIPIINSITSQALNAKLPVLPRRADTLNPPNTFNQSNNSQTNVQINESAADEEGEVILEPDQETTPETNEPDIETIIQIILEQECQNGIKFKQIVCLNHETDEEPVTPSNPSPSNHNKSGLEIYLQNSTQNHFDSVPQTCNQVDVEYTESPFVTYAMIAKCLQNDIITAVEDDGEIIIPNDNT